MTSAALRGSWTSGSSTMIRSSPDRVRVGSVTPSESMRRRSTSRVRSVLSRSAFAVSESSAWSTMRVPPWRSRPSLGDMVSVMSTETSSTAAARTARTVVARVIAGFLRGGAGRTRPGRLPLGAPGRRERHGVVGVRDREEVPGPVDTGTRRPAHPGERHARALRGGDGGGAAGPGDGERRGYGRRARDEPAGARRGQLVCGTGVLGGGPRRAVRAAGRGGGGFGDGEVGGGMGGVGSGGCGGSAGVGCGR